MTRRRHVRCDWAVWAWHRLTSVIDRLHLGICKHTFVLSACVMCSTYPLPPSECSTYPLPLCHRCATMWLFMGLLMMSTPANWKRWRMIQLRQATSHDPYCVQYRVQYQITEPVCNNPVRKGMYVKRWTIEFESCMLWSTFMSHMLPPACWWVTYEWQNCTYLP